MRVGGLLVRKGCFILANSWVDENMATTVRIRQILMPHFFSDACLLELLEWECNYNKAAHSWADSGASLTNW